MQYIMNITVLAGGLSPERDVSLVSGALIANALRRRGHKAALLDLYLGGEAEFTLEMSDVPQVGHAEPDLASLIASNGGRTAPIADGIIEACIAADVTFLALHGGIGENGTLQAMLDCFGIRYTGSGHVGSAMAMDKDLSKRMFRFASVPTADWMKLDISGLSDCKNAAASIADKLGFPCVIKPLDCGSSVGVAFADDMGELCRALETAVKEGHAAHFIAEPKLSGREFSVGVLKGCALPAIEIIPKAGFYDYKNKYTAGMTEEITPAPLNEAETARIKELAEMAHNSLNLGSYSRTDFIYDEMAKDFICLEVNTLPGMTPTSLLPQEARAAGIEYDELCEMIALDALNVPK